MDFTIKCNCCGSETVVYDGYNNKDRTEIKIIGEQIVEFRCVCCDNVIATIDFDIL